MSSPLVAWSSSHITKRYTNFRFVHSNLRSPLYNPTGSGEPSTYVLPFPAASFDVVAATSVFTHLLPEATCHYLQECSRVLVPGGRLFATFYFFDGELRNSESTLRFDHEYAANARIEDPANPEAAVAYRTDWILRRASEAGLALLPPIRWGAWAGRPFLYSGQDVLLLAKQ